MVKLLGKKLGFQAMATWIRKGWAKRGEVKVLDLTNEFFLVCFADEGDYKHALFEGPWLVVDHYLLVQRWHPLFKPSDKVVQKLAVWIQIPELPVELYIETFLVRDGAKFGTMLMFDQNTSVHSRGKFARICEEINLQRKLVLAISILGREFKVEYEGFHLICLNHG